MTTVHLRLLSADSFNDRHLAEELLPVDLDRLSARARALAEVIAATPIKAQTAILLESARTVREMDPNADPLWWSAGQLDAPHRVVWEHWSRYPVGSTMDPHDYLEQQAQKLPIGYYPVGRSEGERVASADAAKEDADLIGRPQVLELLRALGRPISVATLDNYRSKPPKGWPQPVRYVGRMPLWSRGAVEAYAERREA